MASTFWLWLSSSSSSLSELQSDQLAAQIPEKDLQFNRTILTGSKVSEPADKANLRTMSQQKNGNDVTFDIILIGISFVAVTVSVQGLSFIPICLLELVALALSDMPGSLSRVGIQNFENLRQFCASCKKAGLTLEETKKYYTYEIKTRGKHSKALETARVKARGFWTIILTGLPDLLRSLLNIYAIWWITQHIGASSLVGPNMHRTNRVLMLSLSVIPRLLSLFLALANFLEGDMKCMKSCYDEVNGVPLLARIFGFSNPGKSWSWITCDDLILILVFVFIGCTHLKGNGVISKPIHMEVRFCRRLLPPSQDLYIDDTKYPIELPPEDCFQTVGPQKSRYSTKTARYILSDRHEGYQIAVVHEYLSQTYYTPSRVLVSGDGAVRDKVLNESLPLTALFEKNPIGNGTSSEEDQLVAFYETRRLVAVPLEGFKTALLYDDTSHGYYIFTSSDTEKTSFEKLGDRGTNGVAFGPSIIVCD